MKQRLTILVFSICSGLIFGMANVFASVDFSLVSDSLPEFRVSTRPEYRNIFIEEFTGIHCSYCPQAHKIARDLKNTLGNRFDVVAVHTGNLAAADGSEVDFRTETGDAWYKLQGSRGMPGGAMNRHDYLGSQSGGYPMDRLYWVEWAKKLRFDTAMVNLAASACIDLDTRSLVVDVQYYYPEAVSDTTHYLNVILVENNVRTTQAGTSDGMDYLHKHALRQTLTGFWGDTVRVMEDTVISCTYSTVVPEDYAGTAPDLQNLEVVLTMNEGKAEVLNSLTVPVIPSRVEERHQIQLWAGINSSFFGGFFLPVLVENIGSVPVTEIAYSFILNNQKLDYSVSGVNIRPGEMKQVLFPINPYEYKSVNSYSIQGTAVNGRDFESNKLSGRFYTPVSLSDSLCMLEIELDSFPEENHWDLYAGSGNLVDSVSLASVSEKVYRKELCLEKDTVYSVLLSDFWNDGIENGILRLTDVSGTVLFESEVQGSGTSVSFRFEGTDVGSMSTVPARGLKVFPNPAKGSFHVDCTGFGGVGKIEIYDRTGRMCRQFPVRTASVVEADVSGLPAGVYMVVFRNTVVKGMAKILVL